MSRRNESNCPAFTHKPPMDSRNRRRRCADSVLVSLPRLTKNHFRKLADMMKNQNREGGFCSVTDTDVRLAGSTRRVGMSSLSSKRKIFSGLLDRSPSDN